MAPHNISEEYDPLMDESLGGDTDDDDSFGVPRYQKIVIASILLAIVVMVLVIVLVINPLENKESALQEQYGDIVQAILAEAQDDVSGFARLAYMCNTFGSRITGSTGLERATQWAHDTMIEDGLERVEFEDTNVTNWVRRNETLRMVAPYDKLMIVLALGYSVATPDGAPLRAGVVVVRDFDELEALGEDQVSGKIVVYNAPFTTSYSGVVSYRTNGAATASKYGAVASLTRSITPVSLATPHTGVQYYDSDYPEIPAGAITVEDAELLASLYDANVTIELELYMDHQLLPDAPGRNVVGELVGREVPDEILVIGGHIDSWDQGSGAHDDAGGVFHAWEAVRLLKRMGLIPRRTIRVVMWTAEENTGAGSMEYFERHQNEMNRTVFSLESDGGTFTPVRWYYSGGASGLETVQEISDLMKPTINMDVVEGGTGADTAILTENGVPGVGLDVDKFDDCGNIIPNFYFHYHHSPADTMDKIDLTDFQECV
eukprot:CAMPEP_0119136230 /NCGR_PEP_ID=MMETSP1310-20130426/20984_1 /TAXON_ID=464262 /ORGANISM="Genus nov. species nov., Strain RCC2339" /LENGTH=488 /DNA_ID=CAMNT_0007127199 /DNA_START=70 /DNA_END=1533 /DNA_ORIENTATION=+